MKKYFTRLYLLELIAVAFSLFLFLIPVSNYTYDGEDFYAENGVYLEGLFDVEESGYYIDTSIVSDDEVVKIISPKTDLHLGTYDITLKYLTNEHNRYTCSSKYNTFPVITKRQDISLDIVESKNDGNLTISLDTPHKVDGYGVSFDYIGDGYLYVYGLEIHETLWWKWRIFFTVILSSIVLNICAHIWQKEDRRARGIVILLAGLSIFSTLPFMGVAVFGGHDFGFHLGRIEALRVALESGQIPSRISSYWLGGKGYASSIFYCDLFLIVPAIMRMLHSSVQEALVFYILGINVATSVISYYCFTKITKTRIGSALATIIFVLSPYRLSCIYTRAAMGEYTGLVFVPLVFYGLHKIYNDESLEDNSFVSRFKRTLPLVFGVTGIISCHVLTGVIVAIFAIIIILKNWKKTFTKKVLLDFAFSGLVILLLNLWYIVPFIQIYKSGIRAGNADLNGRFRSNGAFIWQLISMFPHSGFSMSVEEGFFLNQNDEMSYACGAALIVLLAYTILRVIGCFPKRKENSVVKTADRFCIVAYISLFMTTIYFPWDFIKQSSNICLLVTQNIQFPYRFLGISIFFSSLLAALFVGLCKSKGDDWNKYGNIFAFCIALLVLVSTSYYFTEMCRNTEWLYLVDGSEGASDGVMGGEYLPEGVHTSLIESFKDPKMNYGEVLSSRKEKGTTFVEVSNNTQQEATLKVPILYYVGYKARDVQAGTGMDIKAGEDGFLDVAIPAGYTGEVGIYYSEPIMWRVCELVSLITLLAVSVLSCNPKVRSRNVF